MRNSYQLQDGLVAVLATNEHQMVLKFKTRPPQALLQTIGKSGLGWTYLSEAKFWWHEPDQDVLSRTEELLGDYGKKVQLVEGGERVGNYRVKTWDGGLVVTAVNEETGQYWQAASVFMDWLPAH